jgi:alkylhydroperoxidase/carboxymuconolactone decarboxylase family protein YurZ
VILQTVPYCGFPAASQALEAAAFVLKERGLTVETAKDRGNL